MEPEHAPAAFEGANLSLFFLALHEIGHIHFQHFNIVDGAGLRFSETDAERTRFGLKRSAVKAARKARLSESHIYQCLELQADSLAIRCFLGIYSPEANVEDLQDRQVCALSSLIVLLLIDRAADGRSKSQGTHPTPGARLFNTLAIALQHASEFIASGQYEMRKVREWSEDALLDDYEKWVARPLLQNMAAASTIIESRQRFTEDLFAHIFEDIMRWVEDETLSEANLRTGFAKECAVLKKLDEALDPFRRP